MKKFSAILFLMILTACNNAATDKQAMTNEPISLNELAQTKKVDAAIESPMKKDENQSKHQNHEIVITVPDTTWSMSLADVIETDTEVAVIIQLHQKEGAMGLMVISELITAVEFESDKPPKIYVTGKTWGWENAEGYEFVDEATLPTGRSLAFEEVEASRKSGAKRESMGTPL